MAKNIVLVFAHPDDESFACGGTIAKYVQSGWDVHLLCLTGGEAGQSGKYGTIQAEALRTHRALELKHACTSLGITSHKILAYKDGGLDTVEAGELEDVIYRYIVDLHPQIVVTFEPRGISNHPDHIRVSRSTTFAFQKYTRELEAADILEESRDPGGYKRIYFQGGKKTDTYTAPKLYYACIPKSIAIHLVKNNNVPEESFGKPWQGVSDKRITTVIDITRFATKKISALLSHISQEDDVKRFFELEHHPLLSNEYFVLRMEGSIEVFMSDQEEVVKKL